MLKNTLKHLNLNSFNKGTPFTNSNKLDKNVNSDHSAIGCVLEYDDENPIIVQAVNISNVEYHKYFELGDNPPFKQTHLSVPKNCKDDKKNKWLISKTEIQMKNLINDLVTEKVHIQIISEGNYDFLTKMYFKLNELGFNFKMISILNTENHGYVGKPSNITAIIINTSIFEIIEHDTFTFLYKEEQNGGILRDSKLVLPWARILNKKTGKSLVVLGIHLSGCDSQNPKGGLSELNRIITCFNDTFKDDLIALGDFNTVPKNIRKQLLNVQVLTPLYPTHMNPDSNIVAYDNISYILTGGGIKSINLLDLCDIPIDSQALVTSILKNYEITL